PLPLACDGADMGAPILAALPVISERIARHRGATPIPVDGGGPTVWEAANARLSCVLEIGDDPAAPGGAYLWEPPGIPDPRAPGSGRAVYTLDIAKGGGYTLAAHVLTPTPENDSFFIRVTEGGGEDILPEEAWHLGVRQAWGWVELKPPLRLPEGRVTITLRARETGTKVTQLRLTPQKAQL
ncbi:MAG: hypothetical protein FWH21_09450, partial [Kiritimatiellaeota bacterium]|nr:hypothetical protein [Kiritimatiellota bacterium]